MKRNILLSLLLISMIPFSQAQLKAKAACGPFSVDVLNGTVDNVKPNFTHDEIKLKYPCFTSEEQKDGKCGTALFFKDRDIYFYTARQYIEIGPSFKGKMSLPILNASRGSLFKWLGNPTIKDSNWDAFQTQYGTLVLHYNSANKVKLIQFSTKGTDELSLCQ